MSVRPENNKLLAYFNAHIAPTLDQYGHGEFKLNKIPVGLNDRRVNELMVMLNDRFGEKIKHNGKRGGIVVIKDTKKGVININLNGEAKTTRVRHDRTRNRIAATH